MGKENPKKGKIDKALQGVDTRGVGDKGLQGRIIDERVGTPERVAAFDALREVARPYEDYFQSLVPDFVGAKTLQPGVKASKYQDYWKPSFDFKVRDTDGSIPIINDAKLTFKRHRTGRFPFWKHDFTPNEFKIGASVSAMNKLDFDTEGKIAAIDLGDVKLNEHAVAIFTGSVNENMGAEDLMIHLDASKNQAGIRVSLVDKVNRTRERKNYFLSDLGFFIGQDRSGKFKIIELEGVINLMKFALARIQKLPPKEIPAEAGPQLPQE